MADSLYYEIKKIEIKQKDRNSLAAKQKVLLMAVRSAFKKLIAEKLNKDAEIAEKMSHQQIQDCIYDYSIENEKYSDSFYIAELTYRFSKKKVAKLLEYYGIDVDLEDADDQKRVKLAIYTGDFLKHATKLNNLDVSVELFSEKRAIFNIDESKIKDFRELGIKYALFQ
ncbi:MAG: hypothetical protein LBS23_02955 [Holosporaceae bacterium]|nr:hypothetical protein [Holosporaceae bacterium]